MDRQYGNDEFWGLCANSRYMVLLYAKKAAEGDRVAGWGLANAFGLADYVHEVVIEGRNISWTPRA